MDQMSSVTSCRKCPHRVNISDTVKLWSDYRNSDRGIAISYKLLTCPSKLIQHRLQLDLALQL